MIAPDSKMFVLVSRSDILNDDQFDVVKNKIQGSLNSSTPVLKSKNGKIDLNYLFDFLLILKEKK